MFMSMCQKKKKIQGLNNLSTKISFRKHFQGMTIFTELDLSYEVKDTAFIYLTFWPIMSWRRFHWLSVTGEGRPTYALNVAAARPLLIARIPSTMTDNVMVAFPLAVCDW